MNLESAADSTVPSSRKRRILMICYYFPSVKTVGCNRSVAFATRLRAHGLEPIILSVSDAKDPWVKKDAPIPSEVIIERAPELNIAAIANLLHGIWSKILRMIGREASYNYFHDLICIPDAHILWLALKRGWKLSKTSELIYVSCSPFSAAITGVLLKRISKKPLIVDFRDPWTCNPYVAHSAFHNAINVRLERWILGHTDALILNTPGTLQLYRDLYPEYSSKMSVIENGFDSDEFLGLDNITEQSSKSPEIAELIDKRAAGKFIIMHVGVFYGSRRPDVMLEALSKLNRSDIEFWQLGQGGDWVDRYKDKVPIVITGEKSHREALELMRLSNLLYLCQGRESGVKHHVAVAAKTYEYLATGLPILADCPPGDNADIVERFSPQSFVIRTKEVDDIFQALERAVTVRESSIEERSGSLISRDFIHNFSWDTLVSKFSQLLDKVEGEWKSRVVSSSSSQQNCRRP